MKHPEPSFTTEERAVMLTMMSDASNRFYAATTRIGCHPFIEFCGLMNEYIKICHRAHADGLDFNLCSEHTGVALPMEDYEAKYLGEKLGCIFGPTLRDPRLSAALLAEMRLVNP